MITPSTGARFVLERRPPGASSEAAPASAGYAATIATAALTYRVEATLHEDGTVELVAVGEPAPAELMDKLAMFAKLTARSAPARRAEGVPVWPARVTRWRPR